VIVVGAYLLGALVAVGLFYIAERYL